MNYRPIVLILAILVCSSSFARQKTDVLVMKNGDHLTCEIKGLDAGVLYVSFDYIDGTSSVDWSKVARVESKQLFLVKTEDGSVYRGTLKTAQTAADKPMRIEVLEAPEQNLVIDSSHIVQMVGTSNSFWRRLNGQIGFGVTYSKANQATQYNLAADASYQRERWNAEVGAKSNLSSSSGASAATYNSIDFKAQHLMPQKNWFYSGLANILQSSAQGISLQTSIGGGIGRYVTNTNRARVAVLGGLAWQNTDYTTSANQGPNANVLAALIYAQANVFRFSRTNLEVDGTFLPALSEAGRIRFNMNAAYYVKLFSNLKWNVSFYGNWDNQPLPGFASGDYGTSSGLSWTFGLK
jgi:hypothetical protein